MSLFPDKNPAITASGLKLPKWGGGDEMIVLFQGYKDISEFLDTKEPARYLMLFDGFNTFSLSEGFKLAKMTFEKGSWYFIHNNGEIEMPGTRAGMIDLEVTLLGVTGEVIKCDNLLDKSGELALTPAVVGPVNYSKIKNPFRGTQHDPMKGKTQEKKDEKKGEKKSGKEVDAIPF